MVLELGRFEGRRLFRSPLIWIGALGSLSLLWYWLGEVAPIWQRDSIYLTGGMLPLAAATMLAASDATRRRRHLGETVDSLPRGVTEAALGVQTGLAAPIGLGVLLQMVAIGYLWLGGPIGSIDWAELAAGPLMVGVFGLGGVLLGSRFRNPIMTPVTLLATAFLVLMSSPDIQIFSPEPGPTASMEWLSPWIVPSSFEQTEGLISRPSTLHLVYLIGLGVLLAAWATPSKGKRRVTLWSSTALLAVGVWGVSVGMADQLPPRFDWLTAAQTQRCETHNDVEYCAFDMYQPWIDAWAHTVDAVDRVLPVSLDRVIQRPSNIQFEEPGALEQPGMTVVGTEWDRDGALPSQRFNLALLAAHSSVGLPLTKQTREWTEAEIDQIVADNPDYPGDLRSQLENEPAFPDFCSAHGQARAVVAVWLAAVSLDRGDEALAGEVAGEIIRRSFWIPLDQVGDAPTLIEGIDAELAYQLLDLPTDQVVTTLADRWGEVVDPNTTSTELAGWFGLTRPPEPTTGSSATPPCA
ncbi:MAG: hypothetical protein WBZ40_09075 [Acidimicrobiia bacterium]